MGVVRHAGLREEVEGEEWVLKAWGGGGDCRILRSELGKKKGSRSEFGKEGFGGESRRTEV